MRKEVAIASYTSTLVKNCRYNYVAYRIGTQCNSLSALYSFGGMRKAWANDCITNIISVFWSCSLECIILEFSLVVSSYAAHY